MATRKVKIEIVVEVREHTPHSPQQVPSDLDIGLWIQEMDYSILSEGNIVVVDTELRNYEILN